MSLDNSEAMKAYDLQGLPMSKTLEITTYTGSIYHIKRSGGSLRHIKWVDGWQSIPLQVRGEQAPGRPIELSSNRRLSAVTLLRLIEVELGEAWIQRRIKIDGPIIVGGVSTAEFLISIPQILGLRLI